MAKVNNKINNNIQNTNIRRACSFCTSGKPIEYKDPDLLKSFISAGGRLLPSRITNICATHQRQLKKEIKIARLIALLPFVGTKR